MDFSSDQTNSTATPGVAPGKPPRIRWLTILILVMVGVTVITGLIAVYDLLSYLLIVGGDVDLSLAVVREHQEDTSLFWPALLVTATLWLWKSLAETSRMRLPALVLTGLALYGVVTWTIMDGADTREPFVVRTLDVSRGHGGMGSHRSRSRVRQVPGQRRELVHDRGES